MTLKTRLYLASVTSGLAVVAAAGGLAALASAAVAPVVTTTIQNSSNSTITSALVNSSVHAQALVSPSGTGAVATGTVDFSLYSNQSCSGSPLTQTGVALVNGYASSSATTLGINGLSYRVHYNGNNDYTAADSACASVSATQNAPALSLSLSNNNVQAGSFVYAIPNLTGESADADGSIAFRVYSNNTCSDLALNAGSKTVTDGATQNSDSWQFITPGTYYWQGVYSGDTNNAAATSSCTGAILTVVATSSTPTTTPATPGTISGTVFNDLNKNDKQNNGEPGLSGWTISLHKVATTSSWWKKIFKNNKDLYNAPIVATATTDGNGNYSFGNLTAGTYFVEEMVQSGWEQTSDDVKVVLNANKTSADVDFANVSKTATSTKNHDKDDHDNNGNHGTTTNGYPGNSFFGHFHWSFDWFNPGHGQNKNK